MVINITLHTHTHKYLLTHRTDTHTHTHIHTRGVHVSLIRQFDTYLDTQATIQFKDDFNTE